MSRILITGTSRGLGKKLFEEFLSTGDEVVSLGRSSCEIDAPYVFCDFNSPENIKELFTSNELLKKHSFSNTSYRNINSGVVAIHSAWKI